MSSTQVLILSNSTINRISHAIFNTHRKPSCISALRQIGIKNPAQLARAILRLNVEAYCAVKSGQVDCAKMLDAHRITYRTPVTRSTAVAAQLAFLVRLCRPMRHRVLYEVLYYVDVLVRCSKGGF